MKSEMDNLTDIWFDMQGIDVSAVKYRKDNTTAWADATKTTGTLHPGLGDFL